MQPFYSYKSLKYKKEYKGLFLVLEGMDGSGKSSILSRITNHFQEKEIEYIQTREPGTDHSEICREIRNLLLNPKYPIKDKTELFLYLADRFQHVSEVIIPALKDGKVVVCDRYIDSTFAYQGWGRFNGNKEQVDLIDNLNQLATFGLLPDITFIFLVDPREGIRRIKGNINKEFGYDLDRIEKEEVEFHERVSRGYLNLIENNVYRNIFAWNTTNCDLEECWTSVQSVISKIIE